VAPAIPEGQRNRFGHDRSDARDFSIATGYNCGMASLNLNVAEVAALVGDPARINILAALMDGRALTSKELSYIAGVTPQTTSGHLAKLTKANLLVLMKHGRRHYYRIASPLVGQMLESIMAVASAQTPPLRLRPSRMEERMRTARTCFDHLAGRLGVALADTLVKRGHVALVQDGGEVSESGFAFLSELGVALDRGRQSRRVFCRPCLDWSERRIHIAGAVGARLCERCLELGWIKQLETTRALEITAEGRQGLADWFGIDLGGDANSARP
jgi:DNA-binding transcriptional ArsR family regulator